MPLDGVDFCVMRLIADGFGGSRQLSQSGRRVTSRPSMRAAAGGGGGVGARGAARSPPSVARCRRGGTGS